MTWHAYAIETEFDNEVNSMRLFSDWTKDYEKAGADFAAEQLESEFEDACETAQRGWSGAFQQAARVVHGSRARRHAIRLLLERAAARAGRLCARLRDRAAAASVAGAARRDSGIATPARAVQLPSGCNRAKAA